ncbi:DUF732 domain-containing protein [Nocardia ignorata]|uniref:Uncharacterized protein DUF732 n=1 Tax=Nocardia ignorata TaxID=145285 RepID=A0A4R6NXP1_NOCIG|nr:DUF732 domain-containing protein [Nocardia ignorata]TDP27619.1 uncharacterized protein DUF732 [Nocardia ignorata]
MFTAYSQVAAAVLMGLTALAGAGCSTATMSEVPSAGSSVRQLQSTLPASTSRPSSTTVAASGQAAVEQEAFLRHVRPLGLEFSDDESLLFDGDSVCNDQTPIGDAAPVPVELNIRMLQAPLGAMTEEQARSFIDAATRYLCPPGSAWIEEHR